VPAAGGLLTEAEYQAVMGEFVEAFEDLMDTVYDLVDIVWYIETDEEFEDWAYYFIFLMGTIEYIVDELDFMLDFVPDAYYDAHFDIVIAAEAILVAMEEFEWAIDSLFAGDYDGFLGGVAGFEIAMAIAEELWAGAVA
jgi:hypothetical protein